MSLQIKQGECFGLLGHNGCGKSTIINIISGVRNPEEGTVKITKGIARVCLQHDYLHEEMTVEQHLAF